MDNGREFVLSLHLGGINEVKGLEPISVTRDRIEKPFRNAANLLNFQLRQRYFKCIYVLFETLCSIVLHES